jgi:hypothetical protein
MNMDFSAFDTARWMNTLRKQRKGQHTMPIRNIRKRTRGALSCRRSACKRSDADFSQILANARMAILHCRSASLGEALTGIYLRELLSMHPEILQTLVQFMELEVIYREY